MKVHRTVPAVLPFTVCLWLLFWYLLIVFPSFLVRGFPRVLVSGGVSFLCLCVCVMEFFDEWQILILFHVLKNETSICNDIS